MSNRCKESVVLRTDIKDLYVGSLSKFNLKDVCTFGGLGFFVVLVQTKRKMFFYDIKTLNSLDIPNEHGFLNTVIPHRIGRIEEVLTIYGTLAAGAGYGTGTHHKLFWYDFKTEVSKSVDVEANLCSVRMLTRDTFFTVTGGNKLSIIGFDGILAKKFESMTYGQINDVSKVFPVFYNMRFCYEISHEDSLDIINYKDCKIVKGFIGHEKKDFIKDIKICNSITNAYEDIMVHYNTKKYTDANENKFMKVRYVFETNTTTILNQRIIQWWGFPFAVFGKKYVASYNRIVGGVGILDMDDGNQILDLVVSNDDRMKNQMGVGCCHTLDVSSSRVRLLVYSKRPASKVFVVDVFMPIDVFSEDEKLAKIDEDERRGYLLENLEVVLHDRMGTSVFSVKLESFELCGVPKVFLL